MSLYSDGRASHQEPKRGPFRPPSGAAAGLLRQLTCCCISGATVSTIYDKLARM